eukprot:TRINITY_DN74189_c0_g1_i1.p1 TRINITY_DN74189_c0_g1~~TRINITY_DN74189_c0_g1_i1.p1  ORF type:complete len:320 (+),score=45.69 TRINITY_DN74189_c0_g1_i1:87-1046(+)
MFALIRGKGGICWSTSQPKPHLKKGFVLLRVRGTSFNPVDYKIPKLLAGQVVGMDVAGVVEEVGPGVTSLKIGDEVFGTTMGGSGGFAEFSLAKASNLGRKPPGVSWATAAALPVAWVTGLQALRDHSKMQSGDKVLVIGASGGTGLAGLQLAKALGASEVVAVCSGANSDLCTKHGADRIIDYTVDLAGGRKLVDIVGEGYFDVVYDCATNSGGGENYKNQGLAVLKKGKIMTAINGSLGHWIRLFCGCLKRQHRLFLADVNTADLEFVANLNLPLHFADGFDGVPLTEENVMRGLELIKSRRARGKVAFTVQALTGQ